MPCSSQITYPNRYRAPQSVIHSSLVESPGARPRVDSRRRLLPSTFTHLPKLGTDLVTTLPRLNVNDFSASRSRASPLPVSHPHRNQSSNTNARDFDFSATKKKRARLFDFPPPARPDASSSSRTSSFIRRFSFRPSRPSRRVFRVVGCTYVHVRRTVSICLPK